MKTKSLYQIFDRSINSELFCFHASSNEEAKEKFMGWIRYHGYLDIKDSYSLKQISSPHFQNNVHNEWV